MTGSWLFGARAIPENASQAELEKMARNKAAKVYAILSDLEWHSSAQLASKAGHRFGAGICVLRDLGYAVKTRRLQNESWVYRLEGLDPSQGRTPRMRLYLTSEEVGALAVGELPDSVVEQAQEALA